MRNLIRSSAPASPPITRPLRIVHVDDEAGVLQAVGIIIQWRLKNLELLQFQRSLTAWHVLSRFDPDLLITDDVMPRMRGGELVRRLAERRITYPIIVISAWEKTEEWVNEYANRGMRISLLVAPFDIATFFAHISRHLGPFESPPAKPGG